MDVKDIQIQELEAEIKTLRNRNIALAVQVNQLSQELESTKAALASALAGGTRAASYAEKRTGRKRRTDSQKCRETAKEIEECIEAGMKPAEIIKKCNVSRSTYYRYVREYFSMD